jgi:hypothetical protein
MQMTAMIANCKKWFRTLHKTSQTVNDNSSKVDQVTLLAWGLSLTPIVGQGHGNMVTQWVKVEHKTTKEAWRDIHIVAYSYYKLTNCEFWAGLVRKHHTLSLIYGIIRIGL